MRVRRRVPMKNQPENDETFRIRHNPDKRPRKIKDPLLAFELRTHAQVAKIMGVTRQRVIQIEKDALAKIRRGLKKFYDDL